MSNSRQILTRGGCPEALQGVHTIQNKVYTILRSMHSDRVLHKRSLFHSFYCLFIALNGLLPDITPQSSTHTHTHTHTHPVARHVWDVSRPQSNSSHTLGYKILHEHLANLHSKMQCATYGDCCKGAASATRPLILQPCLCCSAFQTLKPAGVRGAGDSPGGGDVGSQLSNMLIHLEPVRSEEHTSELQSR